MTTDGAIYLVLDNSFRHIANWTVYEKMYGGNQDWKTQNSIAGETTGNPINADPPLIQAPSGDAHVYLVDNGQKRWIPDWDTFKSFEFDQQAIAKVDISTYPNGPNIPSSVIPHVGG